MTIKGVDEPRVVTGYHQVTVLSSAVDCPGSGSVVMIQAEAQSLRYRMDGIDPTASVGHLLLANNAITINMGSGRIQDIRVIEAVAGGILNVTSFR